MTLNEIIVAALQQMKRGRDAQTIDNYRGTFTQYANMAQQDLSKAFPQYRTETVTPVNRRFDVSELSRWCVKITDLTKDKKPIRFDRAEDVGIIQVYEDGDVDVRYRCLPLPMENATDKPDLPAQLHQCIVSYVVACDRSEGDASTQGGASVYFQLYNEQKRALMRGGYGTPSSYKIDNMERW